MSLSRLLVKGWQAFSSQFSRSVGADGQRVQQPILSHQDILDFARELEGIAAKLPLNPKQSDALRQGEQSSRYMGSGMEYEESRPYEMGDEIRRINWRLMAKTGKAFTKLYQEERQESWFILIDHRASMRFGTRVRLKATQAARVAGYYAWLAQQAGIPVSVGRLAEKFEQSPSFEGRSTFSQIMQMVSKPCPPMVNSASEAQLNDVLLSLSHQLPAGSRFIIISDFHDVDEKTAETLTAMQDFLLVKAVLIKDAAEVALPEISGLQLQSTVNGQRYQLDSKADRDYFQEWADRYFSAINARLQAANVSYFELAAEADLNQLNLCLSENRANNLLAQSGISGINGNG